MERFSIDDAIKLSKIIANRYKWSAENADMGSEDANELNKDICNQYVKEHEQIAKWLEELKSYKEAEEQGLLVRPPCKVGDTVYKVNAGAKQPIIPMTVSEIHFLCYKNERVVMFNTIGKEDMGESCYHLEDIGRIVFLTREEAEKKLEELKNEI